MKPLISVALILSSLGSSAFSHAAAPAPVPTAFEAFASKSSAQVLFSEQVGSLESPDAKATITTLIVADTAQPPDRMRGVRFDLENNSKQDQVYLDETQLAAVKQELAGIEGEFPGIMQLNGGIQHQVMGTENCWMPEKPNRILCPGIYARAGQSGLLLQALRGPVFDFPNRKPSELADLIDRALAELKQH